MVASCNGNEMDGSDGLVEVKFGDVLDHLKTGIRRVL